MNLADLRADAMSYLSNGDKLPLTLIDWAITLGQTAIYRQIRDQWHRKQIRTKYIDVVENQDVYDLGPEVADLRRVERLDLGPVAERVYPLDPENAEIAGATYTYPRFDFPNLNYVTLPKNQIRLVEVPSTTSTTGKDGLRISFVPQPVALTSKDQEPDLPPPTHEYVVVAAVERLAMRDGILLRDARLFEMFRSRAHDELVRYLTPSDTDRPTSVVDAGFYEEIF